MPQISESVSRNAHPLPRPCSAAMDASGSVPASWTATTSNRPSVSADEEHVAEIAQRGLAARRAPLGRQTIEGPDVPGPAQKVLVLLRGNDLVERVNVGADRRATFSSPLRIAEDGAVCLRAIALPYVAFADSVAVRYRS